MPIKQQFVPGKRPLVAAISLGCAKNRIDTEEFMGRLGMAGYPVTGETGSAAVIIVNTCAFIDAAQQESVETILRLGYRRGRYRRPLLIATGCLVERYGARLLHALPELDGAVGVHAYTNLPQFLAGCLAGRRQALLLPPPQNYRSRGPRLLTTPPYSAYVKIAEGCNNHCRYCLIPSFRGPARSRPLPEIIEEIHALVEGGAREINLIAQDTAAYGRERGVGAPDLAELLDAVVAVPGDFWIRLLYAHPAHLTDGVIARLAAGGKVVPYLDLPLQHATDPVLRAMGRPYTAARAAALVERLRRDVPGITLRTTLMVGYPGETPALFRELLTFLRCHPIDRAGVFAYSPQPGTPAAFLPGAVPYRVRERRRHRVIAFQEPLARALNRRFLGQTLPVLVEGKDPHRPRIFTGRSPHQAPEVDGQVRFSCSSRRHEPAPGDRVAVTVTAAGAYDLFGFCSIP